MISIYQSLPLTCQRTIRLLIIEPSSELTAPITGKLKIVSLDERPDFEALSYTWGPRDPRYQICCNGQPLNVTQNCHEALTALRLKDRPRRIWIDAICINQESIIEKNHQVPLMVSIYESASLVVVWLGFGDGQCGVVVELLQQLASQIQGIIEIQDLDGNSIAYQESEAVREATSIAGKYVTKHFGIPPCYQKLIGRFHKKTDQSENE